MYSAVVSCICSLVVCLSPGIKLGTQQGLVDCMDYTRTQCVTGPWGVHSNCQPLRTSKLPATTTEAKASCLPYISIDLSVTCCRVVGDAQQLGAWDASKSSQLEWQEGDNWELATEIPPGDMKFKVRC